MLVHKATRGVADLYWTGKYRTDKDGTSLPVMSEYTLTKTGFSPRDWWEVPRNSTLGKAVRLVYPCFDPVTDDRGELVAIKPWANWWDYPDAPVKGGENPQSAQRADSSFCERSLGACPDRTAKKRRQRRRSGLFEAMLK